MLAEGRAQMAKAEGNKYFAEKNYPQAIEKYTEAIAADPSDVTFFSNRSACYAHLEQWAKSAEDGHQCIVLDKKFVKGYYRLALANEKLGKLDAALDAAKGGLDKEPHNADLKNLLHEIEEAKRVAQNNQGTLTHASDSNTGISSYVPVSIVDVPDNKGKLHQQKQHDKVASSCICFDCSDCCSYMGKTYCKNFFWYHTLQSNCCIYCLLTNCCPPNDGCACCCEMKNTRCGYFSPFGCALDVILCPFNIAVLPVIAGLKVVGSVLLVPLLICELTCCSSPWCACCDADNRRSATTDCESRFSALWLTMPEGNCPEITMECCAFWCRAAGGCAPQEGAQD